ncbi:hypothetical protein [Roseibium sp. RKSG952]|uniref:hypothetical protein n=1 Tax=Roseibium sp. RKSG952 TaxID=2529384 RepID=UPI0012BB53A9|nr:hypothetical protein [Roseibium sp. RKSG952]MTH95920.1 hypothetical protein [Roseibium sp. RKSG952]
MASYGSGGKYWNVGLHDQGRLSATNRQLRAILRLTGEDMRGYGLIRQQASEIIDKAIEERKERREGMNEMTSKMFAALVNRATDAANEAGDNWLLKNPLPQFAVFDPETNERVGVHGRMGHVWITWPPKNSKFRKWLEANLFDGQRNEIHLDHRHAERLELGLRVACETAAYNVLTQSGNIEGLKLYAQAEQDSVAA